MGGSVSTDSTFISTIGTGQAPLVVTSQTLCTNLNANYLGSHLASYFQTALTNPVTGTGTANYITEWSGANTLKAATSIIYDNGDGWVGIGTNGPAATLDVEEPAYEDYQQSVLADVDGSPISGIGSWDGDVALFTSLNGDYTGAVYLSSYDDNYSKLYGVASVDKNATNYFLGNVGIGTTTPYAKLDIETADTSAAIIVRNSVYDSIQFRVGGNGYVVARDIQVKTGIILPDYVFEKNYKLQSLSEVEKYINKNKHLPDVPSAAEVKKNGINVAEMDASLLKKVEEQTLYIIDLQKQIKETQEQNKKMQKEIDLLKK